MIFFDFSDQPAAVFVLLQEQGYVNVLRRDFRINRIFESRQSLLGPDSVRMGIFGLIIFEAGIIRNRRFRRRRVEVSGHLPFPDDAIHPMIRKGDFFNLSVLLMLRQFLN